MKPWDLFSIDEAVDRTLSGVGALDPVMLPWADSPDLVLAETIAADRDQPVMDVSAMDGFAVRSEDAGRGSVLRVVSTTAAGGRPGPELPPGGAARIMTGAPMPPGADAVIRFERVEEAEDGRVRTTIDVQPGEDMRAAGSERRAGETILQPGHLLGPAQLALLASVGRRSVRVQPRARVAVAATGNELVETEPKPWQVRNSNGPMLEALARQCGADVLSMGVLGDTDDALDRGLETGLQKADVVVLSGGVSRGDWDLVPGTCRRAGLRTLVHGVAVKPGKPVLVAAPDSSRSWRAVRAFGLPGNPVSTLVGFLLFVWPTVRRLSARSPDIPLRLRARLGAATDLRSARVELRPVELEASTGGWRAVPHPPHASADLVAVAGAAGLAVLRDGPRRVNEGEVVEVVPMPDVLDRVGARA